MSETVIVCGDAATPRGMAKVRPLSLGDGPGRIKVEIDDIGRRMLARPPDVLVDLLEVAAYVYTADQIVGRGGDVGRKLASEWRRQLRFVIPVREPDRWNAPEVVASLERLLGFMSDDGMQFDFVHASAPVAPTSYFALGDQPAAPAAVDEVVLFSGGLDSLTGAADRLSNESSRLLLVSHQSATKIANRQRELAGELSRRFPGRVLHVPVRIGKQGIKAVERTQRTRSFLFAALASVVGEIAGAGKVSLFENGIVSFNLPIASQVVGTAATRTTHPRVVHDLRSFLTTLLDREAAIENPYLWKTKGEVAGLLRESGHADLARRSVSCSNVHGMTTLHSHCGRCSQCLDRRFGTLSAGLGEDDPQAMYEVDLLTGAREASLDRTMAESFVRHASDLREVGERAFMQQFGGEVARALPCVVGMQPTEVAQATLDLHRRHGASVTSVLEEGYRLHAAELAAQTLPSSCILRIVAGPEGIVTREPGRAFAAATATEDSRDFERSSRISLALDDKKQQILIEGLDPLGGAKSFTLITALAELSEQDRAAKHAARNHRYIQAGRLSARLGISDQSLRRQINRVRGRIARGFEQNFGIPIAFDAFIENAPWKGYRLNPNVVLLAKDQLVETKQGHGLSAATSQLGANR